MSGKTTSFEIKFINGEVFRGRVTTPKKPNPTPQGQYFCEVSLKGEEKIQKGWLNFDPVKHGDYLTDYVKKTFQRNGKEVETIQVIEIKTEKGGNKWQGVFYSKK